MTLDVRTDNQRWQDARAEKIVALYETYRTDYKGSTTALLRHIAHEISKDTQSPITTEGVKYILKKRGLL